MILRVSETVGTRKELTITRVEKFQLVWRIPQAHNFSAIVTWAYFVCLLPMVCCGRRKIVHVGRPEVGFVCNGVCRIWPQDECEINGTSIQCDRQYIDIGSRPLSGRIQKLWSLTSDVQAYLTLITPEYIQIEIGRASWGKECQY